MDCGEDLLTERVEINGRIGAGGTGVVYRALLALLFAARGGSTTAEALDAGARDAASPTDSGASNDASAGYQSDPVTTGVDLPPVIPV